MHYLNLLVFVFLFSPQCFSSNDYSKIDSLRSLVLNADNIQHQIDVTNELCFELIKVKDWGAKDLLNVNITIAQKNDYKLGLGEAYRAKGELHFAQSNYDLAIRAFQNSLSLLSQVSEPNPLINSHIGIGIAFSKVAKTDSSLYHYTLAQQIAKRENMTNLLARAIINIGNVYFDKGEYVKSHEYHIEALRLGKETNDLNIIVMANNNIGNIYYMQGNYEKAALHHKDALEGKLKLGDISSAAITLNNLGAIQYVRGLYAESLDYYNEAAKINSELGLKNRLAGNHSNIGLVYNDLERFSEAIEHYTKASELIEETGSTALLPPVLNNIGLLHKRTKNYELAQNYFYRALALSRELQNLSVARDVLKGLAEMQEEMGSHAQALEFYKQYKSLHDSLVNESTKNRIAELEVKYQVELKEHEIDRLNQENDYHKLLAQKNKILAAYIISGVVFISLLIIMVILIRNHKITQKKILRKIIETEEGERKRFAADLHDGLGPVLSGIKMCLSSVNSADNKQQETFGHAQRMVDEGIGSIKSIVNNITPNSIERHGLIPVLNDFCAQLSHSSELKIDLKTNGIHNQLEPTIEIVLYRIISELINNTLKHANANIININLEAKGTKLHLTYNDDGIGFDPSIAYGTATSGIGLSSIANRVNSLNGKCEITSELSKGMTAKIFIDIKSIT